MSQPTCSLWTGGARHPKWLAEFAVWPRHVVPAEGCKVLPCGAVSPGQQQEKAGWCCCAGVGGRWAESETWPSCPCGKRVTHMPKKSLYPFFLALAVLGLLCYTGWGASVSVLKPVLLQGTTVWLLSSTPEQCPVSYFLRAVSAQKHPQIPCSPAVVYDISLLFHPHFARKMRRPSPGQSGELWLHPCSPRTSGEGMWDALCSSTMY